MIARRRLALAVSLACGLPAGAVAGVDAVQKLVIDAGGERPSYLGPPESFRR